MSCVRVIVELLYSWPFSRPYPVRQERSKRPVLFGECSGEDPGNAACSPWTLSAFSCPTSSQGGLKGDGTSSLLKSKDKDSIAAAVSDINEAIVVTDTNAQSLTDVSVFGFFRFFCFALVTKLRNERSIGCENVQEWPFGRAHKHVADAIECQIHNVTRDQAETAQPGALAVVNL